MTECHFDVTFPSLPSKLADPCFQQETPEFLLSPPCPSHQSSRLPKPSPSPLPCTPPQTHNSSSPHNNHPQQSAPQHLTQRDNHTQTLINAYYCQLHQSI